MFKSLFAKKTYVIFPDELYYTYDINLFILLMAQDECLQAYKLLKKEKSFFDLSFWDISDYQDLLNRFNRKGTK